MSNATAILTTILLAIVTVIGGVAIKFYLFGLMFG